ncbi:hypothetical protein [Nocardia pseudobrasiliensis]|uniref:Outer membrane protein with glycine zipper n=1 Tax=Nocardia pseudobrasiliensis TaxID=45979 RepID=A0A370IED7_9NOCA|nr:hypothetical protein [Nocardia pseudobrasiliensis]RDI69085.1 hypothetical protein DFR76_101623 [Nocardia pseudobrasiliensis]
MGVKVVATTVLAASLIGLAGAAAQATPPAAGPGDRPAGPVQTSSERDLADDALPTVNVRRRSDFNSSEDWWNWEVGHAAPDALLGAGIGAVLGTFALGSGIPGAMIGGGIGLLSGGGQDLLDAGNAYFGGQP